MSRATRVEGREDEALHDLLAVLLLWDYALLASVPGAAAAWEGARGAASTQDPAATARAEARVILQLALERREQRAFADRLQLARLESQGLGLQEPEPASAAARAQAVFCIDVRSEVFRRHLEAADAGVETLGFAGFFGFALEPTAQVAELAVETFLDGRQPVLEPRLQPLDLDP